MEPTSNVALDGNARGQRHTVDVKRSTSTPPLAVMDTLDVGLGHGLGRGRRLDRRLDFDPDLDLDPTLDVDGNVDV